MVFAKEKKFAAALSVFSNLALVILKIFTGIATRSISIVSEAIHSMSDLLASFLALFAVTRASEPADEQHPFGHGKYEDLSGMIEGFLIIGISVYIVFESVKKIITGQYEIQKINFAMITMVISIIANIFVSLYLFKIAKKTDSIALYADAQHLRTDVYSSLAVVAGLILIKITGIHVLDPIVAIIVAVLIFEAGYSICRRTIINLLDGSLSKDDKEIIVTCIKNHEERGVLCYADLKTRKSGSHKNIELKILLHPHTTIKEGHDICDSLEDMIEEKLGNTSVIIHIEPAKDCASKKH